MFKEAHSSLEKSALVAMTRIRLLPTDTNCELRGDTLKEAIEADKRAGFVPFFVCASLGTTGLCAFDRLDEIGPVCAENDVWLHVDAAYAGSSFFCQELRKPLKGLFIDIFIFLNIIIKIMTTFNFYILYAE